MERLNAVYQGQVVFAAVYICEAHAKDEWPAGPTLSFCSQPKAMSERLQLARQCQEKKQMEMPMLVDLMENEFLDQFAAWPFRFFGATVEQDAETKKLQFKLAFKAQPHDGDFGYNVTTLESWLEEVIPPAH